MTDWLIDFPFIVKAVFLAGQDRQMLQNYIEKVTTDDGDVKFKCTMCGSLSSQKPHAINHVENIHFPGCFEYNCKYCGTSFDKRNQYYKHVASCKQNIR